MKLVAFVLVAVMSAVALTGCSSVHAPQQTMATTILKGTTPVLKPGVYKFTIVNLTTNDLEMTLTIMEVDTAKLMVKGVVNVYGSRSGTTTGTDQEFSGSLVVKGGVTYLEFARLPPRTSLAVTFTLPVDKDGGLGEGFAIGQRVSPVRPKT